MNERVEVKCFEWIREEIYNMNSIPLKVFIEREDKCVKLQTYSRSVACSANREGIFRPATPGYFMLIYNSKINMN